MTGLWVGAGPARSLCYTRPLSQVSEPTQTTMRGHPHRGAGLLLIAVGAILRFGIATVSTHGVAIHTIGDILILVGVLGVVLWLVAWAPWTRTRRPAYREEAPVDRGEMPVYREERRVYRAERPADEVFPPRSYPADSPYEDDYRR